MREAYWKRGQALVDGLKASNKVHARLPEGGMFVMVDVRPTGLSGEDFAAVCWPNRRGHHAGRKLWARWSRSPPRGPDGR